MIRNSINLLTVLLFLSSLPVSALADDKPLLTLEPDSLTLDHLVRVTEYVYNDSFTTALASLDSLLDERPGYAPALVIKAGIIYTEMTDDERFNKEEIFRDLIDSSLARIDKVLDNNKHDKWSLFFKGTAMGYEAVWESSQGSWFQAVVKGVKAGKYFGKAAEEDSLFYEAYLGLGALHYWRASKLGVIRKLPFVSDTRDQGIEELSLAYEKSRLSSIAAGLGLCWVHINRKDYRSAKKIADDLIVRGYSGRQILWPRALAVYKMGNANRTIENFGLIRDGLIAKGDQNYYNLIFAGYCMGVAHYWKRDFNQAENEFETILGYPVEKEIYKRSEKRLKKARDYLEQIESKLNDK